MSGEKIIDVKLYDGSIAKLECHDTLPSTSELARQYAKANYPDRYCILAEKLIKDTSVGKSKEDSEGIFLSIILRPNLFSSQANFVAPLTAAALSEALDEHTTSKTGIGWLSDIFIDGQKIGGCTIEGRLDSYLSFEYLIINISVITSEKLFPSRMSDLIKKVFVEENASLNHIIAKTILQKFFIFYRDVKEPKKHIEKYMEKFVLKGKKTKYIEGGKKHFCKIVDMDTESCSLIIEDRRGRKLLISSPSQIIIPEKLKV